MKNFVGIVVALVAGIVLGAFQPRGELLELRQRLDEANAKAARPCKAAGIDQIRSMFQTAGADEGAPDPKADAPPPTPDEGPPPPPGDMRAVTGQPGQPPDPAQMKKQLAELQAALDARRAHAIEALTEQADLSDDQVAQVDALFDTMNDNLKREVDDFVAQATKEGEVSRRDFLELGADALDTVIATDDALRGVVGEEAYKGLSDEVTDPMSYVDGTTMSSLSQVAELPGFGRE